MNFCDVCDNMMFCSTPTEKGIQYLCRCCGSIKETNTSDDRKTHCVYRRQIRQTVVQASEAFVSNPHIMFDPTLPRIQLKCFNDACKNTTITAVRLNEDTLKYMLYCSECKTKWCGENEL